MVDLALGLARAILAVSFVLVTLFALDTWLEPPLGVVRAFALFMVLVACTVAAVFLAKPMRRKLSDDHVALLVEDEYPELHGGPLNLKARPGDGSPEPRLSALRR